MKTNSKNLSKIQSESDKRIRKFQKESNKRIDKKKLELQKETKKYKSKSNKRELERDVLIKSLRNNTITKKEFLKEFVKIPKLEKPLKISNLTQEEKVLFAKYEAELKEKQKNQMRAEFKDLFDGKLISKEEYLDCLKQFEL